MLQTDINKIFGIGLSRTATSSLNQALIELGFRSIHYPNLNNLFKIVESYKAATDTTVALMYKELDKRYPNSKFILTTRDVEKWIKSCEWFFSKEKAILDAKKRKRKNLLSQQQQILRTKLYGSEFFDKESYLKGFLLHHVDVKQYFINRPDDLLIMNIGKGDGYNVLCPFLGKKLIRKKFPHLHNRRYKR